MGRRTASPRNRSACARTPGAADPLGRGGLQPREDPGVLLVAGGLVVRDLLAPVAGACVGLGRILLLGPCFTRHQEGKGSESIGCTCKDRHMAFGEFRKSRWLDSK